MDYSSCYQMTSLLAQGNCTSLQRTQHQALMAMAVAVALRLITGIDSIEKHLLLAVFTPPAHPQYTPPEQRFKVPPKLWSRAVRPPGTLVIPRVSTMPRARGKPRRGAAWYTAESRRQRQRKFEQALAIASTRRSRKPRTPPMAYVEEITLEEAMQSYPPTEFGKEDKPPPRDTQKDFKANSPEDHFPTCFVEEETPLDATTGTATQSLNRSEQTSREAMDSRHQASVDSYGLEQPPFTDLGHLALIFELRSLMDDQVFRLARIDQRLDMLFAAHSKNLPQRQCPTCAQTYVLPAGWRQQGNEKKRTGKTVQ
jgi:hypothetical protein